MPAKKTKQVQYPRRELDDRDNELVAEGLRARAAAAEANKEWKTQCLRVRVCVEQLHTRRMSFAQIGELLGYSNGSVPARMMPGAPKQRHSGAAIRRRKHNPPDYETRRKAAAAGRELRKLQRDMAKMQEKMQTKVPEVLAMLAVAKMARKPWAGRKPMPAGTDPNS